MFANPGNFSFVISFQKQLKPLKFIDTAVKLCK